MVNLINAAVAVTGDGCAVEKNGAAVKLCANSKVFGQKFYGVQKSYTFTFEKDFVMEEYFVLSYSCQGLRRQYACRMPFVYGLTENGEEPLVCYDDVAMDNRLHSVIVKVKSGTYKGIKITYCIDRRKQAHFMVHEMYSCCFGELPVSCESGKSDVVKDFTAIDLSEYYNAAFCHDENQSIIDGGKFFEQDEVALYEIPFRVSTKGKNIIAPSPAPKENNDIIDNFGVQVPRKLCRPISRDSLIEISVNQEAKELFFILSMSGKHHKRWGFAQDGTVLGTITGEVYMPLLVDDTTGFMVEVVYKNGNRDTNLPFNLSLGRHGISGDVSVYGIPTDGSEIEKVIFHNRLLDTDLSVVALTLNNTENRLLPQMLIPEKQEKITHAVSCEKSVSLEGHILSITNGALSMRIDVSCGLRLLEMKNEFIPDFKISESDMLRLRCGNDYCSEFELVTADASEEEFHLALKKDELYFDVNGILGGDNDIKWQLRVKNAGDNNIKTGIIFPCVSGINHADAEDNWYFVPKYQNILSNKTVFIYEELAPSFPMQFLDVFSPKQQGGLSLTTQERDVITRIYALEKNENGIEFYVEYPEMYGEVKAGETFDCSPTVLTAHEGDWRKSFDIYKKWLDSWYEPFRCQDKDWYRKCFWLLTEYCDFVVEDTPITRLPLWNNPETKELYFDAVLEEQKKIAGCYPDILHLWSSWIHRMENGKISIKWGNYGGEDYDEYGGIEKLKQALHKVQDEKGVKVSLYFHPTLLSDCYPDLTHFFDNCKVVNDIGDDIIINEKSYRMCHAEETWREHAVSIYPRVYQELGIPLMYIDEFSLRIENRCYASNHGHPVPSNLLQTDRDFITELKNKMPEEVVLYSEYAAVDIYARYIDCNISYYVTDNVVDMVESSWRGGDGDDRLSRVFTNMYRFAFPKIVQLVLPTAMRHLSWHPQKFIFFNGEAVYDSLWDCEESAGNDFNMKAYRIKKKYADCFSSDYAEGMIDTLSPAVCANRFPGEGRTVYTIYNRAYTTYRGKALRVPHSENHIYFDAWNERPLKTEIKDGYAEIYLDIGAQEMGCIVVSDKMQTENHE